MMFEIFGLVIFGFFVGTYGTLIGIGGGPLIIPFLLLCYKLPPTNIVATSLCVVLFNVVSGSVAYYKQKRIDIITGTKFGIATIPGAILGTYIPQFFTSRFLGILFGILLFLLATYVLALAESDKMHNLESAMPHRSSSSEDLPVRHGQWRGEQAAKEATIHHASSEGCRGGDNPQSKNLIEGTIIDAEGKKYVYRFNEKLGMALSAVIGFISTMLGIGGGVIHVPMLTKVLNFPVHIATATAHYKLFICALFGLIFYINMGYVKFGIAIPMSIGAICGARLGANISKKYTGRKIFRLLALTLFILAIRLLFYRV